MKKMLSKLIRKKFFIVSTTVAIIAVIMVSSGLSSCKGLGDASTLLDTFEVTRGDIIQTITTSGYVESIEKNDYSITVSGEVLHALSKDDVFSKGDVLIEVDNSRQELLIAQSEENLNLAKDSLALAKISYQQALDYNHVALQLADINTKLSGQSVQNALTALEDANEYVTLVEEGVLSTDLQISQASSQSHSAEGVYYQTLINQSSTYWSNLSSTQSAASQVKIAAKNINQTETQLKLSEISLELARLEIDNNMIYAPYDGIVISSSYKEGQYASPGINAISIISSDFVIRADINEIDVINLEIGQDVDIRLDAYYETNFKGKITKISQIPTNIGGVVSFEFLVKPEIKNAPKLLYGLSASLDIITSGVENVLYVPIQSVFEEDGKTYVDVVAGDENIEKREIDTGTFNYDFIEIKSGLSEGDNILISPVHYNPTGSLGFEID